MIIVMHTEIKRPEEHSCHQQCLPHNPVPLVCRKGHVTIVAMLVHAQREGLEAEIRQNFLHGVSVSVLVVPAILEKNFLEKCLLARRSDNSSNNYSSAKHWVSLHR